MMDRGFLWTCLVILAIIAIIAWLFFGVGRSDAAEMATMMR
jgi:hypothetical protein